MSHKFILLVFCFGCTFPSKEKVLEADSEGRILKTFDGQLTRLYDTLGNRVEFYGKVDYTDWQGCVHDKMFYNHANQEVRRISYNFPEDCITCQIVDSMDYLETKNFYSKNGTLIRREIYKPVLKQGRIIGHKLSYSDPQ